MTALELSQQVAQSQDHGVSMDSEKPKITIFNCENNTIEVRDMTDEEIAALPQPSIDPLAE